ncbi:hypothetical protein H0H92_008373 [Tricholoma furcatifolium]|nr:hypothetical protein H0H92_008373 [Tricholoma furcatifolium]
MLSGIRDPPLEEIMQCCPKLRELHIHDALRFEYVADWETDLPSDRCELSHPELDRHLLHQVLLHPGAIPSHEHLEHLCFDTTSDVFLASLQNAKHLKTLNLRNLECGRLSSYLDQNPVIQFDLSALRALRVMALYGLEGGRAVMYENFSLLKDIASLLEYDGPTLPSGSPASPPSPVIPARVLQTVSLTFQDTGIPWPPDLKEAGARIDEALADVDKYPEFVELGIHVITSRLERWEDVPGNRHRLWLVSSMPRLAARGQLLIDIVLE